jgi:hypothetical protein
VVDLHQEGNLVRVFPRHRPQDSIGRGHRITAALDGQPHDVFRVKIVRVFRETRSAGMLDALVHRQNRKVACAAQPAVIHNPLQVPQHPIIAVRHRKQTVHHVRSGQMQPVLGDFRVLEVQQVIGLVAEQFRN